MTGMNRMGNPGREIECDIIAGRSSGGSRSPYFVQINDRCSGIRIAEVRMNADQFASMLTGQYTTAIAVVPSPEALSHIGQDQVWANRVVPITRESWDQRHAIAQQFSEEHGIAYEWTDLPEGDSNRFNMHHVRPDGYVVQFSRWDDADASDDA